jgi:hypothetical protein
MFAMTQGGTKKKTAKLQH